MVSITWNIAGIDLKVPMDIVILLLVKQCAHLVSELSRQQAFGQSGFKSENSFLLPG